MGVVLDPRYKFNYVNSTFEDVYSDPVLCESMKKMVRDVLYLMFEKYSIGNATKSSEHSEQSGESVSKKE